MSRKEASARLKINKLLEESGWRPYDADGVRANVDVESTRRGENDQQLQSMI